MADRAAKIHSGTLCVGRASFNNKIVQLNVQVIQEG